RDLKPANVFVSRLPDGRELAKVLDFGVATAMDSTMTESKTWAPLTEAGFVCGTPAFMSPEQVQGFPMDGRSDLFSAAAVFYQMLTKERPFAGKTPVEVGANIVLKALIPPSKARPDLRLSPKLDAFFDTAMAKKPEDRFATPRAMSEALLQTYSAIAGSPLLPGSYTKPAPQNGGRIEPTGQEMGVDQAEHQDTVVDQPQLRLPNASAELSVARTESAYLSQPHSALPSKTGGPSTTIYLVLALIVATLSVVLIFILLKG
ncbi:MAG: serine/threonine protein kinase, partial [Myxococcales bacterium]|nr:serine/threonine protein kinase [Myxococcales bacterium]